ncbi:hypothetical protein Anapl_09315 [Anas platyrhynchos]|uniref:Uncharacterized protein n=1 Tax=Anas platyrhynchos TaxID=8839 RepID=R0LXS1_ANAPL|nr:hypothetical protein Anapl_09315 [Anas platyrhynchos]
MVLKLNKNKLFGDKTPDSVIGYMLLIFVSTAEPLHDFCMLGQPEVMGKSRKVSHSVQVTSLSWRSKHAKETLLEQITVEECTCCCGNWTTGQLMVQQQCDETLLGKSLRNSEEKLLLPCWQLFWARRGTLRAVGVQAERNAENESSFFWTPHSQPLKTACSSGWSPTSPVSAAVLNILSTMQMDEERPNCSLLSRLWHPVVTTAVLDLEPTAHKATQEQAGFYFASLHGNLVGFVTWLLLAVEESELCHPSSVFCEASCGSKGHNWPPALFCFVYLPCLLSQRYEQGGMIRRALSSL